MVKDFADLAQQAQQGWNVEARAAYDAAIATFKAEQVSTKPGSKGLES